MMLTDLVSRRKIKGEVGVGLIRNWDGERFDVFILSSRRVVKLKPPEWMKEKIRIPANSLTVVIPSMVLTDSGGDTVEIPEQTITLPPEDLEIERFDMSNFVGRYCIVLYPFSKPILIGVI